MSGDVTRLRTTASPRLQPVPITPLFVEKSTSVRNRRPGTFSTDCSLLRRYRITPAVDPLIQSGHAGRHTAIAHVCGMNAPRGSSSRQDLKLRRCLSFLEHPARGLLHSPSPMQMSLSGPRRSRIASAGRHPFSSVDGPVAPSPVGSRRVVGGRRFSDARLRWLRDILSCMAKMGAER